MPFDLASTVMPYTMATRERIELLMHLCEQAAELPGAFVECGVCNGGTAAVLAYYAKKQSRQTFLFDSFKGLPVPTEIDGEKAKEFAGQCVGSRATVENALRLVGLDAVDLWNVTIVEGWFQDTFPGFLSPARTYFDIPQIAVLSLDSDWYQSERLCWETMYPRVVPGGYVYVDDFHYWPGCQRAMLDFFQDHLEFICPTINHIGHSAWIQKGA